MSVRLAQRAHPPWCAEGHHCTARLTDGEHASVPEVWRTAVGRIVATRYRRADHTRDRIEVRAVVDLDPRREPVAQEQARLTIAALYAALSDLASLTGGTP